MLLAKVKEGRLNTRPPVGIDPVECSPPCGLAAIRGQADGHALPVRRRAAVGVRPAAVPAARFIKNATTKTPSMLP